MVRVLGVGFLVLKNANSDCVLWVFGFDHQGFKVVLGNLGVYVSIQNRCLHAFVYG